MTVPHSFPRDLAKRVRFQKLGPTAAPALLAHPDWTSRVPVVLWLHGRTVNKELDPGRYLRWIRAGFAACAIDLPGHGERFDAARQHPRESLRTLLEVVGEIDGIVEALAAPGLGEFFDTGRMGMGGMSLGGMATMRRLSDSSPHDFRAASIEGSTGWLGGLYFAQEHGLHIPPAAKDRWLAEHPREDVQAADPAERLRNFIPKPVLILHSQADEMVPWAGTERFIEMLRETYRAKAADPTMIEVHTWESTGAPQEHVGFGRFSNDAKNLQTAFFARHLGATPIPFADE